MYELLVVGESSLRMGLVTGTRTGVAITGEMITARRERMRTVETRNIVLIVSVVEGFYERMKDE